MSFAGISPVQSKRTISPLFLLSGKDISGRIGDTISSFLQNPWGEGVSKGTRAVFLARDYSRRFSREDATVQAQVLYLPHDFPGELDLNEVNARLRSGEISLDWSHVPFDLLIERVSLERLFAGLDLVEHAEAIGSATIPATLQPLVL